MPRALAVLGLVLVSVLVTGIAPCSPSVPAPPTPTATVLPPGWNKNYSSAGLTLTVTPDHGSGIGAVEVHGTISPDLWTTAGRSVTVELWPQGPFRNIGTRGQTGYQGRPVTAKWEIDVRYDGTFQEEVKVGPVINLDDQFLLIEHGQHFFVLILGEAHAAFARFEVTPSPPVSTAIPAPDLGFSATWLADAQSGWLAGSRCQGGPQPTLDSYGNLPSPTRACEGLIYRTSDGGQTWRQQYRGEVYVREIQSDGLDHGIAIGHEGAECDNAYCQCASCHSSILTTADGGNHWAKTYSTTMELSELADLRNDAWLLAKDCASSAPRSTPLAAGYDCPWYLLRSRDGGITWSQSPLPIHGFRLALSRPTVSDGWIVSSWSGPGTATIIATRDDGATWSQLPHPAGGAGFEESIFFRTPEEGWLLVGSQPGAGQQLKELFRSGDGGNTWTHVSGSLTYPPTTAHEQGELGGGGYTGQIVFTSDSDGWIVSGRLGLIHSSDGGRRWDTSISDDGLLQVRFGDPSHAWALGIRSLRGTTDGGATWHDVSTPRAGG